MSVCRLRSCHTSLYQQMDPAEQSLQVVRLYHMSRWPGALQGARTVRGPRGANHSMTGAGWYLEEWNVERGTGFTLQGW